MDHKTRLNKFKRNEITVNILSHKRIKFEMLKRLSQKIPNKRKFNTALKNVWFKEEIIRKIRKHLYWKQKCNISNFVRHSKKTVT